MRVGILFTFVCSFKVKTWISNVECLDFLNAFWIEWFEVRADCSFWWYWWNCWPPVLEFSCYNLSYWYSRCQYNISETSTTLFQLLIKIKFDNILSFLFPCQKLKLTNIYGCLSFIYIVIDIDSNECLSRRLRNAL